MVKQSALSVRLPNPIKMEIEKAAAADHRSTASLVEKILADWLQSKAAETENRFGAVILPSGRTMLDIIQGQIKKEEMKMSKALAAKRKPAR